MKSCLFLLSLFACSISSFAQYTTRLDERASVIFPSKPQQMDGLVSQIQYSTLDKENKITAMATAIDAGEFGVDSATLAVNYNNPLFVEMVLQSILGQYPGVKVVSKKKIAQGSFMGYDVSLANETPSDNVPYSDIYAQILFAGSKVYALTVLVLKHTDATTERDKFYRSLKVN